MYKSSHTETQEKYTYIRYINNYATNRISIHSFIIYYYFSIFRIHQSSAPLKYRVEYTDIHLNVDKLVMWKA
jgi:hypothetical protein